MTKPTEPRKEANPGTETPRMYLVIFQLLSVGICCWWLPVNEMVASLFTSILHSEVNLTELAVTKGHIVSGHINNLCICHVITTCSVKTKFLIEY